MRCPKCQSEYTVRARFCVECGNKLEYECPHCGKILPIGANFCDECGQSVSKLKATPPINYSEPLSFTPKHLADKILASRGSIEGERKLVTILFADVANYTSLAEKLDPDEVHFIMYGCFDVLMNEIHAYEGTVEKFSGDQVMALFGAPIAHEDHAQRACHAALSIQRAIQEYGKRIEDEYGVKFKMRVGINSGLVIIGSISHDLSIDYTALGDTTNLASRMESMATPGTILVSINTYKLAREFFDFKPIGNLTVKGKEEPVETYMLVGARGVQTRIEAAVVKGLTRFIGREKELTILKESFESAKQHSGQVVGIVGEPGVGKSRLILEFRETLRPGDYTFLEGRCMHYGKSMAYLPILDIIRDYFNIREGQRESIIKKSMEEKITQLDVEFKSILSPLYELLSLHVHDEQYMRLLPPQRRERIFEALRDLIIRESENKPVLIVIEDFHWVDKTTEEFLNYFIGWLPKTSVLLVLLYRPEFTHIWGSKSYYRHISIDQLTFNKGVILLQSILKSTNIEPELRELVLNRAGGNPLFMEEITQTLLENGSIKKKRNNQYVLNGDTSHIEVPDTIQGIITSRIDRLENDLKRTMQVASVIGRDFAYNILQAITGMQDELKNHLLNLQEYEFIYEKNLFPELEYSFKHSVTQEVAYDSLLLNMRRKTHERIGEAIELLYPDRIEEFYEILAYHYARSENSSKAYQYLKLSGEKAERNYSNWESLRFYKEAIDILNKEPQNDEIKRQGVEIRLLAEGPMRLLGYPDDSLLILLDGERLCKELDDGKSLASLHSRLSLCYTFKGEPTKGINYAEIAFREAEQVQDVHLAAPTGFDLCCLYTIAGEHMKIADIAPRVLNLLERTRTESEFFSGPHNFNLYSALSVYYGYSLGNLGDFQAGRKMCEKGVRFAHKIDNVYSIGFAEILYGSFFTIKGDGKSAVSHLQSAVKYGEENQIIPLIGLAWLRLGWGYYLIGKREKALENIKKALKIQTDAGLSMNLSQYYYYLGAIYFDDNDLDEALVNTQEALELAQTLKEKHLEGNASVIMGRIKGRLDKSQKHQAEKLIIQGIQLLEELKLKPFLSVSYMHLGEYYAEFGQKEKALEVLTKANDMFYEMGMDYWLRRTHDRLESLKS